MSKNNEKEQNFNSVEELLRNALLSKLEKRNTQFQRTESTPTSNIALSDIINQLNNIGTTLKNGIFGTAETTHNKLNQILEQTAGDDDKGEEEIMSKQITISEYVTLKEDISEIKTSINWLKWLVPIFVTIGIFISSFIVNSIKETNAAQYQMLEKKLDTMKELNSMQIQRDVAIEIKNQTTHKNNK